MTEQTNAPVARKVLTAAEKIEQLKARIAKDTETLAELVAAEAAKEAFANVGAGDTVEFKVGRAETRRTLRGSVIARAVVDSVDVVQVIAGEGLDTAVYRVKVAELVSVNAPVAEPVAEQPADQDAQDQADVDALLNDPLSSEVEAALNAVQIG